MSVNEFQQFGGRRLLEEKRFFGGEGLYGRREVSVFEVRVLGY